MGSYANGTSDLIVSILLPYGVMELVEISIDYVDTYTLDG